MTMTKEQRQIVDTDRTLDDIEYWLLVLNKIDEFNNNGLIGCESLQGAAVYIHDHLIAEVGRARERIEPAVNEAFGRTAEALDRMGAVPFKPHSAAG